MFTSVVTKRAIPLYLRVRLMCSIMDDPKSYIGSHVSAVPTPVLLVNKNRVEQNSRRMLDKCKGLNISLRAQTKTHKTVEGALMQKNGNKRGLVVSTLAEAVLYAENGFDDILYGFPLMEHHAPRCYKLMEKLGEFHVMVNSMNGVDVVEQNSPPEGKKWSVFVKVSAGYKRAGIPYTQFDRILTIASRLNSNPKVMFQGLYVHCGNSYRKEGVTDVRDESVQRLLEVQDKLLDHGIKCKSVGVGSTPSCSQITDPSLARLTEMHPGNYIFYDCQQESYGSCTLDDIAVRVQTRVVSHHLDMNVLLVDLGFTGLTRQGHNLLDVPGFGRVQNHPNLMLSEMTQELGKVTTVDGTKIEFEKYPIGSVLHVYPYHSCAATGMHSHYFVHDDNDKIIEIWFPTRGW